MLEPGGFTTKTYFPGGKVIKTRCFPYETRISGKTLARSSFVLEAFCEGEALNANAWSYYKRQC